MTMTEERFSFNLVDEPWIPCVMARDGSARELSLRDVFAQATEIREIADPSPPVTVALHRLLLAILHRALRGPEDAEQWAEMWNNGWDQERVRQYLDTWRSSFDIFDPDKPFYQNGNIGFDEAKPIGYMVHGMIVGNNATLFDHSVDSVPPALSAPAAARYLLALQGFALGGFVSSVKGENRAFVGSADASPLSRGIVTLVTGGTLFKTLMLNLHQYDAEAQAPFPFRHDDMSGDKPAWERDAPTRPENRNPDGYVDLLTWQSRRARLQAEHDADQQVVVRRAAVMKGYQFDDGWYPAGKETMLAYREITRTGAPSPYSVVSFGEARALWRDSDVLLGAVGDTIRPPMIGWLGVLIRDGHLPRSARYSLSALGVLSDRKSIDFWRMERMPLPATLLDSPDLVERVEQALRLAERVGHLFNRGFDEGKDATGKKINIPRPMQIFADALLAPGDDRSPDPGDIANLVKALEPAAGYWPRLETPFKQFIIALGEGSGADAFARWIDVVERAARVTFEDIARSFTASSRGLKAASLAERRFYSSLSTIVRGYRGNPIEASKEGTDAQPVHA